MNRILRSVAAFLLLLILTVPYGARAETATDAAYRAYLLEIIALLQQQVAALITQQNTLPTFTSFLLEDETDIVARYQMTPTNLAATVTNREHRRLAERILTVAPATFDSYLQELVIYDGIYEFDAFVETIPPYRDDTWRFGLYGDILKFPLAAEETTALLVHEIGHIVSYDGVGTASVTRASNCHSYFADFDCPPLRSYLDTFITEFWTNQMLRTLERYGTLTTLVTDNDQAAMFVSEYAASAPAEDFAESFATFVLEPTPTGEALKDEKVRWFYSHEELVSWRAEMRRAIE
jgi:hypothetical protein